MENSEIAQRIRRVINGELDDCETALHAGDIQQALSELDDAMTKLKRLIRELG
jgi:hypothetical protein